MALAKGKSRLLCGALSLHTETAIHVAQLVTKVCHLQNYCLLLTLPIVVCFGFLVWRIIAVDVVDSRVNDQGGGLVVSACSWLQLLPIKTPILTSQGLSTGPLKLCAETLACHDENSLSQCFWSVVMLSQLMARPQSLMSVRGLLVTGTCTVPVWSRKYEVDPSCALMVTPDSRKGHIWSVILWLTLATAQLDAP